MSEVIRLARDFACEQFVALGMAADLNVQWDPACDGETEPYARLLLTTRKIVVGPSELTRRDNGPPGRMGFGLKEPSWSDRARLFAWRAAWAELANARLAEFGHDARVDHRSHAVRGIMLEPHNKIGPAAMRRDRRGEGFERADEHRAIARRNADRRLSAVARD